MVLIILFFILLVLILLLAVENKNKIFFQKRGRSQESRYQDTVEEGMVTELLQEHGCDFQLKGKVLNNLYRVEAILGEGGMGKVYLCTNIKLGNLWALKYITRKKNKKLVSSLAEADILKKLNHIYLPQIVDIFYDEGGTYIVESYIEGASLDKKMKMEGIFKEESVLKWVNHLTDALMYLHEMEPHPIIYRDMKPSNVMITPDDKAVLIDFGVSMEYKGEFDLDSQESTIAITAKFAAPEQFKGYADARTDIYSLGVMILYLLTGLFPEEGKSIREQTNKISKEMLKIIEKCICKEMNKRYQSVKELKKDLNRISNSNSSFLNIFKSKPTYQLPQNYKKIIVTLGAESAGKTTIAVSLAWHFAQQKVKTILIDTDFINKDVYYFFDRDFANCLGNLNREESFITPPIKINRNLSIYAEHRDVGVFLSQEEILELVYQSKRDAQVVIIDLGSNLDEKVINDILSLADHKLLVLDQRVNLLNRIPQKLYSYRGRLQDLDIVINRYHEEGYIKEKNIRGFFTNIEVDEEISYDIMINKIFRVGEDYGAILKALEERIPPVAVAGNKLKGDISRLAENYYS